MMTKSNYFFVLPYSPWPLACSISSLNLLFSLLMMFKFMEVYSLIYSLSLVSSCSFFWWLFYSKEFGLEGKSSNLLESGIKFSMILFISSEVFFFFSFFDLIFTTCLDPL